MGGGGSGNGGGGVLREPQAPGEAVRAFVRDLERAAEKLGDGVELAPGDLADAASVRRAMAGVDRVFLACANEPRQVEYEVGAIEAAREAGVRRIVKLSALGAGAGSPVAFWDWHARIERHLRSSGVPAVVLRPAFYMTNLLGSAEAVRHTGKLFAPAAGARIAMIDPRDVAAVAAVALTQDGHHGRTCTLTGPEAVTYEEVAAQLSGSTGRAIGFVPVPDEAAREAFIQSGAPDWMADQFVTLFGLLRRGAAAQATGEVRALIGREPSGLTEFAHDFAHLFGVPARESSA